MALSWELVGVPYTSMREPGGIDRAIGVLRGAGLADALARHGVADGGDLELEAPSGSRGRSGLLNEAALGRLVVTARAAVELAHSRGRLPLLVGGDCPVLLGPLAALGGASGGAGLAMIDGHEDAWPPPLSPTGEASDSELGIALGLVGDPLPDPLDRWVPLVDPAAVALLGPRDAEEVAAGGAESLRARVALFAEAEELLERGPDRRIELALARLTCDRLWLHVDLDALRSVDFAAVDYPQPGGLDWHSLRRLIAGAVADPRFAGASVVIYNPDLDPDREGARSIIKLLVDMVGGSEVD